MKAKEELKEECKKWKEAEERYRMQEELLKKSLDIAKKTKKEIEKTIASNDFFNNRPCILYLSSTSLHFLNSSFNYSLASFSPMSQI
ncbi:uncharacterized protein G2W53_007356 [Senna tora]|uniref:Uncharacterized protein n=1 Tax=Senna tora TaxID=362788 RepID=A0A835CE53_9FABA|nr:uncharacterized protein G2W53_007356 [Senna tora]